MKQFNECERIERSIQTRFKARLWSPFVRAIKEYDLIKEGDKIAVCISGGKDSMLLAKLMQQLQKYSDFPFEVCYIVMDPGYNLANRQQIVSNASRLEIPISIFESNIFSVVTSVDGSPCYLCARMRRGFLYNRAQELGCNKIALGHHFNDVVETTLIGMLYGAQFQAMMPKVRSKNFANMELIRPMYCVHEDNIISWAKCNNLQFIQCACRFTENCASYEDGIGDSKRLEIKNMLKQWREKDKDIEQRIFKSFHMVNLDTVVGFKHNGVEHAFLDEYNKKP